MQLGFWTKGNIFSISIESFNSSRYKNKRFCSKYQMFYLDYQNNKDRFDMVHVEKAVIYIS